MTTVRSGIKDADYLFAEHAVRRFVFAHEAEILATIPEEYVSNELKYLRRQAWQDFNEKQETENIKSLFLGKYVLYHLGSEKIIMYLEDAGEITGFLTADLKIDDITEDSYELYLTYMFVLPDAQAEKLLFELVALGRKLRCNKIIVPTVYKSQVAYYKALGFDFRFRPNSSSCYDMDLSVDALPPPLPVGKNEISTNLRRQAAVSIVSVMTSGADYVPTDPGTLGAYMMADTAIDDVAFEAALGKLTTYVDSTENVCGNVGDKYLKDRLVPGNEYINFLLYVKKPDDSIHGFALCKYSKEAIILDLLCGAPGIKGAGEMLLKAIQVIAFTNGVKKIELSSLATSYGFYKKYGFCFAQEKAEFSYYSMEYSLRPVGGRRRTRHSRRRGHKRGHRLTRKGRI